MAQPTAVRYYHTRDTCDGIQLGWPATPMEFEVIILSPDSIGVVHTAWRPYWTMVRNDKCDNENDFRMTENELVGEVFRMTDVLGG